MGGASGGARDARMRGLIEEFIAQGASERTAARIVEGATAQAQVKPLTIPVIGLQLPRAEPPPVAPDPARVDSTFATAAAPHRPTPGSTEPIAAVPVRTLTVRAAATAQNAAMAALSLAAQGTGQMPPAAPAPAPVTQYHTASVPAMSAPQTRPAVTTPTRPAAATAASEPPVTQTAAISTAAKAAPRSGWIIQIGAFPDETEARERLQSAQSIAKGILGKADPFTERVVKGRETLYRARFVGLDEHRAEAACKYFKRNNIDCFTVKN
jgi:D-alanyl-D-alanine carboxypeptidase